MLAKRKKGARKWKFPTHCPVCDQPFVRPEGEADTRCVNVDCPAQRVQRIVFFAGRSAMDIEGLGEERVTQFVEAGLLNDAADVYDLTVERLVPLERIGERSAQLLVDAIEQSQYPAAGEAARRASASATSGPARPRRSPVSSGSLDAIDGRRRGGARVGRRRRRCHRGERGGVLRQRTQPRLRAPAGRRGRQRAGPREGRGAHRRPVARRA